MQSIANDKSLGNRTRGQSDSQSSEAESESSLQSARTARCVLVLRDCDALAAAHCVKKLFRSGTDTVGLSVPQARGCARRQKKFQRSREHQERFAAAASLKNKLSSLHWKELSLAITSRGQQPESQPKPGARGLLGTRYIVCDIGKLNHPMW